MTFLRLENLCALFIVIEPSAGIERAFLAILNEAYNEESLENGKNRVVLKLKPHLAPVKAAVIPLKKNDMELVKMAKELKNTLQKNIDQKIVLENTGNIGKSYRKHDEIGTPYCITIDFDSGLCLIFAFILSAS